MYLNREWLWTSRKAHLDEVTKVGLTLGEIPYPEHLEAVDDETIIWPENYQTYLVFNSMSTQWRVGFNGRAGLDYNVLNYIWQQMKVPEDERDEVFYLLQVMEAEALRVMNL